MESFFTEAILGEIRFTCCFHRIHTGSGIKLFLLATDPQGNNYPFSMEKENGEWKLAYSPKPHKSITENETTLSQIIKKHLDQ